MEKEVVFESRDGMLIASVGIEIDHHSERRIRELIDEELFLRRPSVLIIDFSAVKFMDSSGIALVLGRVQTARAVGASVRLCGACEPIMKLMRLSGMDRVKDLSISPSSPLRTL